MATSPASKPGVIDSIKEFLSEADEAHPIAKREIHRRLVERFPDRDPEAMRSTVDQQVPHKLGIAGFVVKKNSAGYWLPSEGGGDRSDSSGPGVGTAQPHYPQTIRIDREVWEALQKRAVPLVDKPNDVLRRLLGLPST